MICICSKPLKKVPSRNRWLKTCGDRTCSHRVQANAMMDISMNGISKAKLRAAKAVATLTAKDPEYFKKHAQRVLSTLGEAGREARGKQCSATKQAKGAVNQTELAKFRRSVAHYTRKQDLSHLPNFEKLKEGYQIDHILSVVDGFKAGLTPKQVAHKANLQVLSRQENRAKYTRSDMTPAELLEKITW